MEEETKQLLGLPAPSNPKGVTYLCLVPLNRVRKRCTIPLEQQLVRTRELFKRMTANMALPFVLSELSLLKKDRSEEGDRTELILPLTEQTWEGSGTALTSFRLYVRYGTVNPFPILVESVVTKNR